MSAYALLAIDLDGTLIDHSLTLRAPVIEAVARAQAAGVTVTIVTGRMFVATRPFAQRLGVHSPVVCYQGAAIFDAPSGALVEETPLASDAAMKIYAYAKANGLHVQMYKDDKFYAEEDNKYARLYAHLSGAQPNIVASLPQALAGRDPTKVNIITEPEKTPGIARQTAILLGKQAYITRSNPEFVEFMNPEVNKGRAFTQIARMLGIPLARSAAIGDSYNDIPLLQSVALGVAMGSGPAELKTVAGAVVGDYANDGVAEAIDRFVLGREPVAS